MSACQILEGDGCLGNLCMACTRRLERLAASRDELKAECEQLAERLTIAEAAAHPVFSRRMLEDKLAAAEARIRGLEEDVAFLAPRAHKDGEWYADENRDFGLSANNLVNVAYGAKDAGNRPYDKSDLRACERAYAKLPAHRMTEEVRLLLVACRAALAPPPEAAKRGEV